MYPDSEHYYNDNVYSDYRCLEISHDEDFLKCLISGFSKISPDEIHHEKYQMCTINRLKKCREENGTENILKRHLTRTRPIKCDKENLVYTLTKDESNLQKPYDECNRPFVIHKIPNSNLILLVTNRLCAQVFAKERDFDDKPKTIEYPNSTFCERVQSPQLLRIRPGQCLNYHKMVREAD
jgi:hypothetical protein